MQSTRKAFFGTYEVLTLKSQDSYPGHDGNVVVEPEASRPRRESFSFLPLFASAAKRDFFFRLNTFNGWVETA